MKTILVTVVLLVVCGVAIAQNDDLNLDALLGELFSTPPTSNNNNNVPVTTSRPSASSTFRPVQPASNVDNSPAVNNCLGECVAYYLCANNSIIRDGSGLIDIRIDDNGPPRPCADYLEECCAIPDKLDIPSLPVIEDIEGCGVRHTIGVGMRISGGEDNEAEFGEFPWMVAVLKEERALDQTLNVYQCGGSVIHAKAVLTAAHCVAGKDATSFKVRAGEWDTQTKNEIFIHQDQDVESMVVHSQYSRANLKNDIALLFLQTPLELGFHISPVCLPPQDLSFENARCFASGWGKDVFGKAGKYQVILKKIELPIVTHNQCETSMRGTRLGSRFKLSDTFICAGGEQGKDTCKGDGGSPLVCPVFGESERYYQSGIVAWGIGCGENQVPGVYVNVARFRNWIDEKMRNQKLSTNQYTYKA